MSFGKNISSVSFAYTSVKNENRRMAGCWWLVLVIPATQKAEIRRVKVQSKPRQIIRKTLS
jgi:hypothetical protein